MSVHDYGDLNDMHLDVMREIGNIGIGNAVTSLAGMLGRPVDIDVPRVLLLDFETATEKLGGPENMVVGLLFALGGDVTGMVMFLLQRDFAHMVLSSLMGVELNSFVEMDDMGVSAMKEIGNIMAASYMNAIAQMTGMIIDISVPDVCIDMVGSILSVPAIHFANISDKIIYIEDDFQSDELKAQSQVLFIPEVDSLNSILTRLGISM